MGSTSCHSPRGGPCLPPIAIPDALAAQAGELQLARGDNLFCHGGTVEKLYFVRHGELAAIRPMVDGGEAIMLTARSGEFFGEPSLFMARHTCEARALADSLLIAWPLAAFKNALLNDPAFSLAFMQHVITKMRLQCSRLERLRLKHAHERVLHYMTCGADAENWIALPGTIQEWACELGLEPATLYRTLSQLEETGKIVRDKRRIRLACPTGMHYAHIV